MSQRRRRAGLGGHGVGEPQAPLALLYEWASADERRAFHFFQHVTAPCLSGDLDGAFWRMLVLQICQSEPAVRHAVLAVSSLHEGMVQATMMIPYQDADHRHSFALFQYNRAIACLLDQMRTVDARPLVPLLTCVLFVCIELMQSKDKESLIHLEQGRQILNQLGRRVSMRNPEIDLIKQHLVPMYTRLSLTSLMFGGDPVPIPTLLKTLTEVPMMFETIDEVRYALYDFMDESLRFAKKSHVAKIQDVPQEDLRAFENEQDYLLRKLAKFNVAFSLYQSTKSRDAPPGAIALIQIHTHTTYIWISTALSKHETVFDDYVDTFSAIIPLATEFLNTLTTPTSHRDQQLGKAPGAMASTTDTRRLQAMFTFEMSTIAPLYFVAAKCRHPMIRRAALDLLRRTPGRRENLWRANVMAAIAEHTMRLEEKHLRPPRSEGQADSRSASPPDLSSAFPYTFGPGDAWASSLPDVPFPDNFRMNINLGGQVMGPPPVTTPASSAAPAVGIDAGLAHDLSNLSHMPIDPTLLFDATEVSSAHSFSVAPSIASSLDDLGSAAGPTIYVGGAGSPLPSQALDSQTALWGGSPHAPPGIALEPPTPRDESVASYMMGPPPSSHHSHSSHQHSRPHSVVGSPSIRSEDSPQMHPIDMGMSFGQLPPQQQGMMGTGFNDHDLGMMMNFGGHGMHLNLSQTAVLSRSADAPYDVPERFRVHESIIGPDKEDGSSWVMMFRKLGGLNAEWDVLTEYVTV
ncbi:transcriptional regulatory protein moc3 [Cladorrhinum sp. PSN332]|nr:transcriptional regulatory protein moc3 [Cladorrhinum sp. PSN332]